MMTFIKLHKAPSTPNTDVVLLSVQNLTPRYTTKDSEMKLEEHGSQKT